MAEDVVILDERGVRVTTTRAVIGGTTYPINGITSVRNVLESPSFLPIVACGLPGVSMLLCGGFALLGALSPSQTSRPEAVGSAVLGTVPCIGIGALLVGLAVLFLVLQRSRYYVVVGTAGGDRRALSTPDPEFAARVREAIEEAITRRG